MNDFSAVQAAARQLPARGRLRQIVALWITLPPPDTDAPFTDEWAAEIQRRVTQLDSGAAETVPWETIRREAMDRMR